MAAAAAARAGGALSLTAVLLGTAAFALPTAAVAPGTSSVATIAIAPVTLPAGAPTSGPKR